MSTKDTAAAMATATTDELRGLIASSPYRSTAKVAAALDIDYTNLTRNIAGTSPIKMATLYRVLALLDADPGEFFARVAARANRQA